ncbi:serine hydrolase domain-containing protein [Peribacillus kribbensis]|uniref:serine hydrolase domain-containing protein n=1 Tax=Peribacillus kribbensis TaxID=356658 RepID=UPI000426F78F|nr:serine hydrolase domain-containing protein [Peribacillus kribbensis]
MKLGNISIKDLMEHYNVTGLGLALIENGQLSVVENYGLNKMGTFNFVKSDSIFNACSISKFLTGMLVMILTEQGILELDENINKKLRSWRIPVNKFTLHNKITLRHLLSHQSGVVDPDDSFYELDSTDPIPSIVELLKGKTSYCKAPIEVSFEPGSEFQYSDAGFCIIQQLIQDATGKTFEVLANELLFKPLKMENSLFPKLISELTMKNFSYGHNKKGQLIDGIYAIYPYPAASGLWTTPTDLAKLVIELISSLKGKSKIGLSKMKAKEMISPQGCKDWTGLGVFLDGVDKELEISSLGWGVGFQSMMVACPYQETGLVIMTNTDLEVHQLKGIIGEIYNSLTS